MKALLLASVLLPLLATPHFDVAISKKFLFYAYASYNLPEVGEWTCPYCIKGTLGFVPTVTCHNSLAGAQSYVGYNEANKEIIVSFRGSSNIQNWILDLDAVKTPPNTTFPGGYPGVQIEEGFSKYYNSVQTCIIDEVLSLHEQYPEFRLGITGHSLGAAVAAICAVDLAVNHGASGDSLDVYTFGEPRVGNAEFARVTSELLPNKQRMVDHKDPVPHLPPKDFGYQHAPWEIYETTSGGSTYRVCDGSGEDPTCSNQWGDIVALLNSRDHLKYMGVPCCSRP